MAYTIITLMIIPAMQISFNYFAQFCIVMVAVKPNDYKCCCVLLIPNANVILFACGRIYFS